MGRADGEGAERMRGIRKNERGIKDGGMYRERRSREDEGGG